MKHTLLLLTLTICYSLSFSQNKTVNNQPKPFVLGEIHELQSAILSEKRILNIYLPEGYNASDTAKYPVVYLLDGGADEDFIHITGLYQFDSFQWINRVPRSIIVGIANTSRRRDMTYPTNDTAARRRYPEAGHSDKFISFLQQELQPYIQKKFKTTSSKTIIGESLGGLLAAEILLKNPKLFNNYIIVSPSIWWNNGSLLNLSSPILQEGFSQKTIVYIGVGKEGLTSGNPPRMMEADANWLADKIKNTKSKAVTVYFDYLPQEDHATIMHQAVFNALRMMNPPK